MDEATTQALLESQRYRLLRGKKIRRFFWEYAPNVAGFFGGVLSSKEITEMADYLKSRFLHNFLNASKIKLDHEPDIRPKDQYLYDVYEGWFHEEVVLLWLNQLLSLSFGQKYFVDRGGRDKTRDFVFEKITYEEISTDPDFVIKDLSTSTARLVIELQQSRDGVRKEYHIKVNKARKLIERKGLLIFTHFPAEDTYFVVPGNWFSEVEPISNPAWGGKLVYPISRQYIEQKRWGHYKFASKAGGLLQFIKQYLET